MNFTELKNFVVSKKVVMDIIVGKEVFKSIYSERVDFHEKGNAPAVILFAMLSSKESVLYPFPLFTAIQETDFLSAEIENDIVHVKTKNATYDIRIEEKNEEY